MTLDTSVGSCGLAPDELKRITSGSMPLNTFVRIASSGSFDYASLRSLVPLGIQRLDHLHLRDSQVFGNVEVISRAQRAATLPSQQGLAVSGKQLLGGAEPTQRARGKNDYQ